MAEQSPHRKGCQHNQQYSLLVKHEVDIRNRKHGTYKRERIRKGQGEVYNHQHLQTFLQTTFPCGKCYKNSLTQKALTFCNINIVMSNTKGCKRLVIRQCMTTSSLLQSLSMLLIAFWRKKSPFNPSPPILT